MATDERVTNERVLNEGYISSAPLCNSGSELKRKRKNQEK
jgi:hypothetical protein